VGLRARANREITRCRETGGVPDGNSRFFPSVNILKFFPGSSALETNSSGCGPSSHLERLQLLVSGWVFASQRHGKKRGQ
jgi:hypothetical protein